MNTVTGIFSFIVCSLLLLAERQVKCLNEEDDFLYGQFPSDFKFGVGTSSYQIEGGWDADGKGENIWDTFTHQQPSPIKDSSTGDIACGMFPSRGTTTRVPKQIVEIVPIPTTRDSYHNYKTDVALVKNLGVDYYRFSVSWSRILPDGTTSSVNPAGLKYYSDLIDLLIENGITPVITLHHWDLPTSLQEAGGWLNEELIEHFANFAQLLFDSYGDRVQQWITFNEACVICVGGYGNGAFAPGIKKMAEAPYTCFHNIIKAHATAYRIYERDFKDKQRGQVGITIDSPWLEPADPNNPEDIEASQRALLFKFGLIAHPLVYGDYPEVVRQKVGERSKLEGRSQSRLPSFDSHWRDVVKGSYDFLGFNHYSSYMVTSASSDDGPGWEGDQNARTFQRPEWPESGSTWLRSVPWGFRKVLNWVKDTYNNPPLIVTENGYSDLPDVFLDDYGRIEYYKGYLNNLLKAVTIDGCNVKGYGVWSLMDNFEWASGYEERFGLHWVNFTDPNRERIPKKSVSFLKNVFLSRGFPNPETETTSGKGRDGERFSEEL